MCWEGQKARSAPKFCRVFVANHDPQWFGLHISGSMNKQAPDQTSPGQGLFCLHVAGEGFEPSKLTRRIYSPLPLAARATRQLRVPRLRSGSAPWGDGTTIADGGGCFATRFCGGGRVGPVGGVICAIFGLVGGWRVRSGAASRAGDWCLAARVRVHDRALVRSSMSVVGGLSSGWPRCAGAPGQAADPNPPQPGNSSGAPSRRRVSWCCEPARSSRAASRCLAVTRRSLSGGSGPSSLFGQRDQGGAAYQFLDEGGRDAGRALDQ